MTQNRQFASILFADCSFFADAEEIENPITIQKTWKSVKKCYNKKFVNILYKKPRANYRIYHYLTGVNYCK